MSQLPPKEEETEEAQKERWRGLHEVRRARLMKAKVKKITVLMEKIYSRCDVLRLSSKNK